ncbi:MAG: hypothetical protein KIG60_01185 [Caryophanon sp.]|nr:hypothetical protein [Caryophanon sp.]
MKLSKEDFVTALPSNVTKGVNSAVVDYVNEALADQDTRERFKENLFNYNKILSEGKYKVSDYISAVMYISFKSMNYTNIEAFERAFPEKMARYTREGKTMDQIHNFVSAYNRTKLVVALTAQAIIPTHILNQDLYQESINVNAKLMRNASREDVRQRAAEFLATHLAPPVDNKVKLDIGVSEDFLSELRNATDRLVDGQLEDIRSGRTTAAQIARTRIIEGVSKDVVDV